jgi:hypothetical protein
MNNTASKKIQKTLAENINQLEAFSFMENLPMGDEEGTPNDELGAEFDLDQALTGDLEDDQPDIVDNAIESLMDMLVSADYEEESAEEAVFDAIATLIDDQSITDTPEADASSEEKTMWVTNSVPKIKSRLKELGLEF